MRIAFYYNHQQTLGHTTRTSALANAAHDRGHEVLIFNGGEKQEPPVRKGVKVLHVPNPYLGREHFRHLSYARATTTTFPERTHFLTKELRTFQPDVFVTEYFPLGRDIDRFTLLPALRTAKKECKAKLVCSAGYPLIATPYKKVLLYARGYDKILIHSPPGLEQNFLYSTFRDMGVSDRVRQAHEKTFTHLKDKLLFTNYVIDLSKFNRSKEEVRSELGLESDDKLVLVSRGGGAIYPHIIAKAITAMRFLPDNWKMLAVAGISSSGFEMSLFTKLVNKYPRCTMVKQLSNLGPYLQAADASISMSGYNTSLELLWLRKSSMLVPRLLEPPLDDPEQIYRSNILHDYLGSTVLHYSHMTPQQIAESVLKIRNIIPREIPSEWFSGTTMSIDAIEEFK